MKVSLFEQVPYRYLPDGFGDQYSSAVTPPYHIVDPARMQESLYSAYAELMHGARAGFDGIVVTEHRTCQGTCSRTLKAQARRRCLPHLPILR